MRALAEQSGATSFMVMQAALAVLLGKIAELPMVVGFRIAGRKRSCSR